MAKQQPTNHYNFHILTTNHNTRKLTNPHQDPRHKYHHLTTTLHLTLKMTTAQVVEMSVTNNSLSKGYIHPDHHAKQITDTPGFKPLTKNSDIIQYVQWNLCQLVNLGPNVVAAYRGPFASRICVDLSSY